MKSIIFFGAIVLVSTQLSAAENILPAPKKLSDHVYAWIGPLEGPDNKNKGYRMNMAFVVGADAVAVIDTGYTPAMAKEMISHIKKITDRPIRYAINTNSQPHRYMGNDVFAKLGTEVIAHRDGVTRMSEMGGMFAQGIERILELPKNAIQNPAKPKRIITEKQTLKLGGLDITIDSLGAGHTPAQLVVLIPSDKLVYAGDALYSGRLLAVLRDSDIVNWIAIFEQFKTYGDVTFIPGHGQPAKLSAFEFPTYSYLKLLQTHMSKAIEDFVDLQDAINSLDQSAYKKLENYDILAGRNASWAYVTLEAKGM